MPVDGHLTHADNADCSDLFSHIKIDLPTAKLAAASAMLVDLQLI